MAQGRTHRPVARSEGCKRCEMCRLLCPDLAVAPDPGSGEMRIDLRYCKGCGICAAFCPKGLIRMVSEPEDEDVG
jgi:pyruvate ferredoxin oxidoreductase delta subunit